MLHKSRNSGREFAGWNQLPCGPVLTPNISCKKFKIHSAHADSPIVPKYLFFISCTGNLDVGQVSALHADQETQEENLQGGTSSLAGQFLHPISLVQSSRSIQRMQTAQLFLNVLFYLVPAIWMQDQSMLHRSRNSGREFAGWNQLPCGPVLTPNISCTKLKIHSAHTILTSFKLIFNVFVS